MSSTSNDLNKEINKENNNQINKDMNKETIKLRKFGIVFAVFFGLISVFKFYFKSRFALFFLCASAVMLGLAFLKPNLLFWPEKLWMKFGDFMSSIMTRVMVFLIFVLAIIPTALIMRALGKRPLKLAFDKDADSYWEKFDKEGPCSRPYLPY